MPSFIEYSGLLQPLIRVSHVEKVSFAGEEKEPHPQTMKTVNKRVISIPLGADKSHDHRIQL